MMMAALTLAGCAQTAIDDDGTVKGNGNEPTTAASAIGFDVYTSRQTASRAGVTGELNTAGLQDPDNDIGKAGFGVFAYFGDNSKYNAAKSIPDFMYNQQVKYTTTPPSRWDYEPLKYWPNEYGDNAQSGDTDRLTFFAYAPWTACTPSTGEVDTSVDATADQWGITGFTPNSAAGDPAVYYTATLNPTNQVDLCWGTVHSDCESWSTMDGTQTLTVGKPYIDVEHPAGTGQKMKLNFQHALAALNVQIDADPDIAVHDESSTIGTATKVYVRSVTFTGFTLKGALNLNNTVANVALWTDSDGQDFPTAGSEVTLNDGRADGSEGQRAATGEKNICLNTSIISDDDNTQPGVTHELKNLFNDATATTPVYVIPDGNPVTVTVSYDVETASPNLAQYLSDGHTHGSSINSTITKEITFGSATTLACGKKYTLKLHIGMNSMKFDADISTWDVTANGNGWLPNNTDTAAPVTLSLGSNVLIPLTAGVGTPVPLTAITTPEDASVTWSNTNDAVASIAAAGASPAPARRAAQEGIGPCRTVIITPVAVGTTVVTATTSYGSASCLVTVTDENTETVTVTLNKTETSIYATESETLTATTDPSGQAVTWMSTNPAAATVSDGVVSALKAGVTYISAISASGHAATCEVTVKPTELTLTPGVLAMKVDEVQTLTGTTIPVGKTITFTSGDESVATVNSSGEVTAIGPGTTTITATIDGGGKATCTVSVSRAQATVTTAPTAVTGLTYDGSAHTLVTDDGAATNGTMQYAIGTSAGPTSGWSTTIPEATNAGTYYVWYRAKGAEGYLNSDPVMLTVTIDKAAGTISYDVTAMTKTVGEAKFTNALTRNGDGTVTYSISNSGSNATIDASTGEVTLGTLAGTATVTATVVDGTNYTYATKTATYTINILPRTSPEAGVTPDNWGSGGDVDVTPDKNGL